MRALYIRGANIALRGSTMVSRFALIFGAAKLLEPAEFGLFGLFMATVGFCVLLVGGDYYTYTQRKLLSMPRTSWSFVLQHQAIGSVLLYVILFPPQLVIFWLDILPGRLLPWFLCLVLLEHIAQELNRLLIAMQRQLWASWVLLIRNGLWVWVALPIMWFNPSTQRLEFLFWAWLAGCVVACGLGAKVALRMITPWQFWPVDIGWIRRGIRVGFLFLIATLCLKALFTIDRYAVQYFNGEVLLGAYVLYSGIAMTVVNFLGFAVFSFLYPQLVSAYRKGEVESYRSIMRELVWSAIIVSGMLAMLIAIAAPWIIAWIGKPIYGEHLELLWILLGASVAYGISMVPHYGLYAAGKDTHIVAAHVSSLLIFTITTYVAESVAPTTGVPIGLLIAFSWMGVFKGYYYIAGRKHHHSITINYEHGVPSNKSSK